ncbi:MAG: patatin-like phospholipase family protein [Acetobacteraceae bacterium]|nr:patatin-like phospholipase family protein [Acetobacteraceae bacterium]
MPDRPSIRSAEETLTAEREFLRSRRAASDSDAQLAALCLSGGGIRSAAFGLGVLQSLASARLLTCFDYLSTVSGGGFIGGWLQVLIARKGADGAEATLRDPQATELVNLRSYTNYLTPQVGPFTTDTWAAVALYLRNLLLNWLVIVPVLLLVVLVLVMHRTAVATFGRPELWPALVLVIGLAMLFAAAMQSCLLLPSHRADSPSPNPRCYAQPSAINRWILLPTLGWSLITPVALHGLLTGQSWAARASLPVGYVFVMLGAYAAAWARQPAAAELFRVNARSWFSATLLAAGALAVATSLYLGLRPEDAAQALTTLAPLALTLCHMLHAVIYVGLRRERAFADLDREWIARLDGMVLLYAFAWAATCLCCLELSSILLLPFGSRPFGNGTAWTVAIVTVVTGPGVAWIGKQAVAQVGKELTGATRLQLSLRRMLDILAAVFAIGLFGLFGAVLQFLLGVAQIRLGFTGAEISTFLKLLGLQIVFGAFLYWLSWRFSRVNVNRFSLHGVYRNRLSRAFLGSALEDRKPDPFTGFGPLENPRLAELAAAPGPVRLFPVINIALNLTRTTHTAWAERKAASFTATPLACGSAELRNPNDGSAGAFVATPAFAGATSRYDQEGAKLGLRLGTALTISGAAVSPNWGYNSSPIAAFLMTLFNVRLGAWMPNPAVSDEAALQLASPKNSQTAIFSELIGVTTDERDSIYLSDGGHFDNLGVYEMLRRRCRRLLVVDAGQDAEFAFADLGNAIRKAAIDGLAEVTMEPLRMLSRGVLESGHSEAATALGLAVGRIAYPGEGTGVLIYLKPSYLPSIPAEIRAYGAEHPEFPHESTAEQWFTESQFESYRALGRWQIDQLLNQVKPDAADPLSALFKQAWTMAGLKSHAPCSGGAKRA